MKSSKPSSESGLTLVEILVTLAVIALMMGLIGLVFQGGSDAKLAAQASQLAGTIRYLYNEAAVKNQYYRLLIDLDQRSFSAESSAKPFKIGTNEEGTASAEEEAASLENKPSSTDGSQEADLENSDKTGLPSFSAAHSYLLKPIQLSDDLIIKDVYVAHAGKKIEGGKTAIYFFPNGWVEKAIINLSDEKGETFYSLETFPSTGKTKIRAEYFEKPEENE